MHAAWRDDGPDNRPMTITGSTGRRALRGAQLVIGLTLLLGEATALRGQGLTDYTPNTRPAWTMDRWHPAMILAHRFELIEGGDELISIPTMTFALGLSSRVALGFDFTSNSEVTPES